MTWGSLHFSLWQLATLLPSSCSSLQLQTAQLLTVSQCNLQLKILTHVTRICHAAQLVSRNVEATFRVWLHSLLVSTTIKHRHWILLDSEALECCSVVKQERKNKTHVAALNAAVRLHLKWAINKTSQGGDHSASPGKLSTKASIKSYDALMEDTDDDDEITPQEDDIEATEQEAEAEAFSDGEDNQEEDSQMPEEEPDDE
jgi:hypothetical protein